MNENENFRVLNLVPRRGRPKKFENIVLTPLYKNIRQITTAKFKDIIDLLRYIPPQHHDSFKSLFTHKKTYSLLFLIIFCL